MSKHSREKGEGRRPVTYHVVRTRSCATARKALVLHVEGDDDVEENDCRIGDSLHYGHAIGHGLARLAVHEVGVVRELLHRAEGLVQHPHIARAGEPQNRFHEHASVVGVTAEKHHKSCS